MAGEQRTTAGERGEITAAEVAVSVRRPAVRHPRGLHHYHCPQLPRRSLVPARSARCRQVGAPRCARVSRLRCRARYRRYAPGGRPLRTGAGRRALLRQDRLGNEMCDLRSEVAVEAPPHETHFSAYIFLHLDLQTGGAHAQPSHCDAVHAIERVPVPVWAAPSARGRGAGGQRCAASGRRSVRSWQTRARARVIGAARRDTLPQDTDAPCDAASSTSRSPSAACSSHRSRGAPSMITPSSPSRALYLCAHAVRQSRTRLESNRTYPRGRNRCARRRRVAQAPCAHAGRGRTLCPQRRS